jgi:voltage-gated potassium channel
MNKNLIRNLFRLVVSTTVFFSLLMLLVYFENKSNSSSIVSLWDAFWFSIVTLTTVGYGDLYPITFFGKIIGLIFILSSLGLLGYFLGVINEKINNYMENKNKGEFGTKFTDHFVIIGWDEFSKLVAIQVANAGKKIAIVTDSREELNKIYDEFDKSNVFVLYSDLANYKRFEKTNLNNASAVFVNFDDDSKTLIKLINIKKLYNKPKYVVSLRNSELKDTFKSTGVTFSISVNEAASKLVASYIFEPDVALYTEDLMGSAVDKDDNDILQYYINENSPIIGQPYLETFINLKKRFNVVVLGLSRLIDDEYKLIKNPNTDIFFKDTDYIILLANGDSIPKIESYFGVEEGRKF